MLELIIPILSLLIISIIGYLLSKKDSAQEKQIEDLYDKHETDAAKLQSLEVKIAENHYQKNELDVKFDKLETIFRNGIDKLVERFDHLSSVLLEHISKE